VDVAPVVLCQGRVSSSPAGDYGLTQSIQEDAWIIQGVFNKRPNFCYKDFI